MRAALVFCAVLCACVCIETITATATQHTPAVLAAYHGVPQLRRTSDPVLLELGARTGFGPHDYVPQPGRVVRIEYLAGRGDAESADVTTMANHDGGRLGYAREFHFAHVEAGAVRRVYRARLNLPTTGERVADMRARLQADQNDADKMRAIATKYPLAETQAAVEGGTLDQFLEGIRAADDATLRTALLERLERVVARIRAGEHLDADVMARALSIMETQLEKEEEVVESEGPRVSFVREVVRNTYAPAAVPEPEQTADNPAHVANLFAAARTGGNKRVLGTFNVRDLSVKSRTRHDFVKLAYVIARNLPDVLVVQEVRDGLGTHYDNVYTGAVRDLRAWHEAQRVHHYGLGNAAAGAHATEVGRLDDVLAHIGDPNRPCATAAQFATLKHIHGEFSASKPLRTVEENMRAGGSVATLVYHLNHLLGVNAYTGATTVAVQTGDGAKPEGYGVIWRRSRAALSGVHVHGGSKADRQPACFVMDFHGGKVPVCTSHLHFGAAYDNAADVDKRAVELVELRTHAQQVAQTGALPTVLLGDFNLPPAWVAGVVLGAPSMAALPPLTAPADVVAGMRLAIREWAHATTVGDVSSFDNMLVSNTLQLDVVGVPPHVMRSQYGWVDAFDRDLYPHPKRTLAAAAGCLAHEHACRMGEAERDELHCPSHCELIWADFDNEERRVHQLARKQVSDHRPVFSTVTAAE